MFPKAEFLPMGKHLYAQDQCLLWVTIRQLSALVQKQTNAGTALSATSIFNGREMAEVAGFAVR
jgi:hypothetical protein